MPRGNPVTSTMYADLLKNHLRPAIKSKRHRHLSTGVLLQHDNARSHTAYSAVATNQDCPLSVFQIRRTRQTSTPVTFMPLDHSNKEAMGCKSFRSDEEVQRAVHEWLHSQPKEFFSRGMRALHFRSTGTPVWNAMETT
jgi:hypothetical protein